ncbi:LacI family DNA-binding transcriptional regulator [Marinilabilia rubra]|uniref:LacI family transcriptional regulator n=1 Tax=Marinilabilia rubra TaxID=2162893 RepID=A0A2U2B3P6_9BACT|nr:LacI family DNA-binding transcriptional regulator [Marinilabilia rubra]PWD97657.1 LacI family transcriptional regulator [Marinilabilia rubra]
MNRTTLAKVAGKAGVSKTTASLVLNGKADKVNIASNTRQRVMEVAKSLNYHPGKFSPGKLNGQSGIIGLFASSFIKPETSKWLQHLIMAAEKEGYIILPQTATKDNTGSKINAIPFDAVILAEKELTFEIKDPNDFEPPVLCLDFIPSSPELRYIAPSKEKQTNEIITQFYHHNKKAIGLLCINENSEEQKQLKKTYLENYCDRFDIPPNITSITASNDTVELIKACDQLIENGANGIIFETPQMVVKAMSIPKIRNLAQRGIMLAAFERIEGADFLPEGTLITLAPNYESMSEEVIDTLTRINNEIKLKPR